MSRAKNEAIGEVECPQKGCVKKAPVYRFQARGAGRARFAGKLYSDCPVHGRYGADAKQGAQEYILENATIWGDNTPKPPATPATVPVIAPAPAAAPHWTETWGALIK
jgi:hypothetical protein